VPSVAKSAVVLRVPSAAHTQYEVRFDGFTDATRLELQRMQPVHPNVSGLVRDLMRDQAFATGHGVSFQVTLNGTGRWRLGMRMADGLQMTFDRR